METGFKTVDALLRLFPNLFVIDSDVILRQRDLCTNILSSWQEMPSMPQSQLLMI